MAISAKNRLKNRYLGESRLRAGKLRTTRLQLAYGREGLWIELPEDAPVTVIELRFVPGLPDERTAITAALRSPVSTSPLPHR